MTQITDEMVEQAADAIYGLAGEHDGGALSKQIARTVLTAALAVAPGYVIVREDDYLEALSR